MGEGSRGKRKEAFSLPRPPLLQAPAGPRALALAPGPLSFHAGFPYERGDCGADLRPPAPQPGPGVMETLADSDAERKTGETGDKGAFRQ